MGLIHIPFPVLKPILNNVRVRPQSDSSPKKADLGFAVGLQINLVQAVSLSRPHFFSPSFVLQAPREGEPVAVPGGQRPGVSKAGAISVSQLRASTRRPSFPALLRRRAGRPPRETSECATRHDRLSSGSWEGGEPGSFGQHRPPSGVGFGVWRGETQLWLVQGTQAASASPWRRVPDAAQRPRPSAGPGPWRPLPRRLLWSQGPRRYLGSCRAAADDTYLLCARDPEAWDPEARGPLPPPSPQPWGPKASPLPSPQSIYWPSTVCKACGECCDSLSSQFIC